MKTWNNPEITELNINETANGILDSNVEFWWITNDNKKASTTDPVIPTDPDNNTDRLS